MRPALAAAGLLLLTLTACADPSPAAPPPLPANARDCGTSDLMARTSTTTDEPTACFLKAVEAHQPARLQQTAPTTEGDPIRSTYTADATGRVDATVDASDDRYAGAEKLTRQTCTGISATDGQVTFAQCS